MTKQQILEETIKLLDDKKPIYFEDKKMIVSECIKSIHTISISDLKKKVFLEKDKKGNTHAWMSCLVNDNSRISYQIIRELSRKIYKDKYNINIFVIRKENCETNFSKKS